MNQLAFDFRDKPAAYACPVCGDVSHLGVEFCRTHGWFPGWRVKEAA